MKEAAHRDGLTASAFLWATVFQYGRLPAAETAFEPDLARPVGVSCRLQSRQAGHSQIQAIGLIHRASVQDLSVTADADRLPRDVPAGVRA